MAEVPSNAAPAPVRPRLRFPDLRPDRLLRRPSVARADPGMVGNCLAMLASARQRRARSAAYDGPTVRAAADGRHLSGPARALAAVRRIATPRGRGPALRPVDPRIRAPPPRQALGRSPLWRA